jgi:hypothetical protein
MKVRNLSVRDSVLILWKRVGVFGPSSLIAKRGEVVDFDSDIEILGTYKLVQCTKLVDDPTVTEVTDE